MNTTHLQKIYRLRTFVADLLKNEDNAAWQICYCGIIPPLDMGYIMIRPYMIRNITPMRVFVTHGDEMKELSVDDYTCHMSSKSISIFTNHGMFSYNRETGNDTFTSTSGGFYNLEEFMILT